MWFQGLLHVVPTPYIGPSTTFFKLVTAAVKHIEHSSVVSDNLSPKAVKENKQMPGLWMMRRWGYRLLHVFLPPYIFQDSLPAFLKPVNSEGKVLAAIWMEKNDLNKKSAANFDGR